MFTTSFEDIFHEQIFNLPKMDPLFLSGSSKLKETKIPGALTLTR